MLNMSDKSRETLLIRYDFIDNYGFELLEYCYNKLGVESQKVYDDIYLNNDCSKINVDLFYYVNNEQ